MNSIIVNKAAEHLRCRTSTPAMLVAGRNAYFSEERDAATFCASTKFGEKCATRSRIAFASSSFPSCCNACASNKNPTSVGSTSIARENRRTASAGSPFFSAINPSPTIAKVSAGSNCTAVSKYSRIGSTIACLEYFSQSGRVLTKEQDRPGSFGHCKETRLAASLQEFRVGKEKDKERIRRRSQTSSYCCVAGVLTFRRSVPVAPATKKLWS